MQRILRVKNWAKNFETSETRKWKHLKWLPVSNNQCDPGYSKLMRLADGPLLFGAWIGILQAASRCKVRGTFIEGDGTPYDAESLAAVAQMPTQLIERAIEFFTTQIKWLEWFEQKPSAVAEDSAAVPSLNGTERNGIELNGTELNRTSDPICASSSENSNTVNQQEGGAHVAQKLALVLRPRTPQDRDLIAKVSLLRQRGAISERAVWDAASAVESKRSQLKKPACAYFQTVLAENAASEQRDLRALLAGVRAPPELIDAMTQAPDERMVAK